MEQEKSAYTIVTQGYVELVSDNKLLVHCTIEELAKSFGADPVKLKESWGDDEQCVAHCTKHVDPIKDDAGNIIQHKISCTAGGSCSTPSECHIIKKWVEDDKPKEEDMGVGPITITRKTGVAYICRCIDA